MADLPHDKQESPDQEKSSNLFSDESMNITLDEEQLSLFITPNNLKEDLSSDSEDGYLCDLLGGMAAKSPTMETEGAVGGLTEPNARDTEILDPFDDVELDDSVLIKCTEDWSPAGPSTVIMGNTMYVEDSEEEGDLPSLMSRVRKNVGSCVDIIKSKPPICPPKKGTNVKNSKIHSVGNPNNVQVEEVGKDPLETSKKSRFHKTSEKEMQKLQLDAKAARTHQQTRWGVNILKGGWIYNKCWENVRG